MRNSLSGLSPGRASLFGSRGRSDPVSLYGSNSTFFCVRFCCLSIPVTARIHIYNMCRQIVVVVVIIIVVLAEVVTERMLHSTITLQQFKITTHFYREISFGEKRNFLAIYRDRSAYFERNMLRGFCHLKK